MKLANVIFSSALIQNCMLRYFYVAKLKYIIKHRVGMKKIKLAITTNKVPLQSNG